MSTSLQYVQAHTCKEPYSDSIWGARWTSKDHVISISVDGQIKQFDSNSGQTIRELPPHTLGLVSLSVSPSGHLALYNTIEGLTCLWDLENGDVLGKFESYVRNGDEQTEPAWSVSLHPDSKTYAATGSSGNITIHSAESSNFGEQLKKLDTGRNKFGMYTVHSPNGLHVAMASETGQIYVFDVNTGTLATTYTSHAMTVRSLAWSADSLLLLSASDDKRLVLHDVRVTPSGKLGSGPVASLNGHSSWVLSTSISPDNRLALSGSADKTIKVWDIAARAAVFTTQDSGDVWDVCWRPQAVSGSNGAFVTAGDDGIVKWWRSAGSTI